MRETVDGDEDESVSEHSIETDYINPKQDSLSETPFDGEPFELIQSDNT